MIRAHDLEFQYPGAKDPVLRGLRLTVKQGSSVGLVGPPRSGKTTLIRLLTGSLRGPGASLQLMGRPVDDWGPELMGRLGVVPQQANHYAQWTAAENLRLVRSLLNQRTRKLADLLAWFRLSEYADQHVKRLPLAIRHRLAWARSILHDPDLWVIDEPHTEANSENLAILERTVRERVARGLTVFVCTRCSELAQVLCHESFSLPGPPRESTISPLAATAPESKIRKTVAVSPYRQVQPGCEVKPS